LKHGATEGNDLVIHVCDFDNADEVVCEVRVGRGAVPADLNKRSRTFGDMTEQEQWVGAVAAAAVDELATLERRGEALPPRLDLDLHSVEEDVRAGRARLLTTGPGRSLGSI
jgi:hypothetical protein